MLKSQKAIFLKPITPDIPAFILFIFLRNDNFCDCSDCADEESWTCGTCGAFNEDEDQQEAQDVGAGMANGDEHGGN